MVWHTEGEVGIGKEGTYRDVLDVLNKDEEFIPFPYAERRLVHLAKLDQFVESVWNGRHFQMFG